MGHRARNWDVWGEVSHRVHMLIAEGVMFGFSGEQTVTVLCTGCLLGCGPGQMPVGGEAAGLGREGKQWYGPSSLNQSWGSAGAESACQSWPVG